MSPRGTQHDSTSSLPRHARPLAPFFISALFLLVAAAFGSISARADENSFDDNDYLKIWEDKERGVGWNVSFGLNGGYTDLLNGYPRYENLGNVGIDVYFRPPVPLFPKWKDKLAFRLSGDYVPLQPPKEVYGITEDIYSLNATILYRFINFARGDEHKRLIPFVGGGVGAYWDRISLDHPALDEKVTRSHAFLGLSASGGFMLPSMGRFRLIPEVRYHSMKQYAGYWASYISYQLGLVYWLPSKVKE